MEDQREVRPKDRLDTLRERQEMVYRLANEEALIKDFRVTVSKLLEARDKNDPEGLQNLEEELKRKIEAAYWEGSSELMEEDPLSDKKPELRDPKGLAKASVLKDMLEYLREAEEEHDNVGKDKLTGLPLRATFTRRFRRSLAQLSRNRHKLSEEPPRYIGVILVDVDRFKSINDKYLHDAGDAVLQEVAQRLRTTCRDEDIVVRHGGEEFSVILNNIDGPDAAMIAAERLRKSIESTPFRIPRQEKPLKVTASFGVVTHPSDEFTTDGLSDPDTLEKLILSQADTALYAAKKAGRNRSVLYAEDMLKAEAKAHSRSKIMQEDEIFS